LSPPFHPKILQFSRVFEKKSWKSIQFNISIQQIWKSPPRKIPGYVAAELHSKFDTKPKVQHPICTNLELPKYIIYWKYIYHLIDLNSLSYTNKSNFTIPSSSYISKKIFNSTFYKRKKCRWKIYGPLVWKFIFKHCQKATKMFNKREMKKQSEK